MTVRPRAEERILTALEGKEPEEVRKLLIDRAITDSTRRQYLILHAVLERFVVLYRQGRGTGTEGPITSEEFIMAIGGLALTGHCGSTFEGYRSALRHWAYRESCASVLAWIDSPMVKMCVAGARKNSGDEVEGRAPPRGAIAESQLEQLVRHANGLKQPGKPSYAGGFQLAWYFMLRHGEMLLLQPGDLMDDPQFGRIIKVRDEKSRAYGAMPRVVIEDAYDYFDVITDHFSGLPAGEPVFSWWDRNHANWIIKDAARNFGWRVDLSWDMHALRHGAATAAVRHKRSTEEIMRAGGWRSADSMRVYQRAR